MSPPDRDRVLKERQRAGRLPPGIRKTAPFAAAFFSLIAVLITNCDEVNV